MKIVFVCNEYPPQPHGGIGTFVQTLARALHRKGHHVTIVGLGEEGLEHIDDGIPVVTLRSFKLPYVGNLLSRMRLRQWLAVQVKAKRVDIVEVPDYLGLLPFRLNSCPVVIRLHLTSTAISLHAGRKIPKGIAFYERRTLTATSNWIAVSYYILGWTKMIFDVSPKHSAIIYNPVPPLPAQLPEIAELPDNYILYAGQISKRKGALVLAEAALGLMASRPDLHLVYVGGELRQGQSHSISDQVREIAGSELAKRIHFLGHMEREKVLTCMKRAKVFVFPSSLEALGLVVLEAMSCGLPVVCTSVLPGPEMVDDGVNGLLADPTSPKDLSDKIARLLDDPALAERLAKRAQRMVSVRFSLEKCIEETERFYKECIEC